MKTIFLILFALTGLTWAAEVKYTYDAAGRLVTADYGTAGTISYSYDKAGNLTNRTLRAAVVVSPSLSLQKVSENFVLVSWPTNESTGFSLQSAPWLPAGGLWSVWPTPPSILDKNYVITNRVTFESNAFFRLRR